MPGENSFMRFQSGQYQFKVPFVIYADFEAILQGLEEETELDPEAPYTKRINCHVSPGFCTYSACAYGDVKDPLRLYRAKDCVEVFYKHIQDEAKILYPILPAKLIESLTSEQQREFHEAGNCHICLERFEPLNTKDRDHCHYTGKYRGAAHQKCNLLYAIPHYIPSGFHNLSGYDMHLFIRELERSLILDKSASLQRIRRSTSVSVLKC